MGSKLLQAILLGVVQGIGEFLPISSSGHLVVITELLKRYFGVAVAEDTTAMVIALHVGTLFSILVVYRHELITIWRRPRLVLLVILGTIPAAVVGLTLKSKLEATFHSPLLVGCGWLLTAITLTISQRLERGTKSVDTLHPWSALVIGMFQMLSVVIRGFSRSGSTISGGLLCGLKRESAAEFSFLLAIPAIGGAALVESRHALMSLLRGTPVSDPTKSIAAGDVVPMLVGTLVSFVVGVLVLKVLLRLISRGKLYWFAIYCAVIGVTTIIWQIAEHFLIPAAAAG